MMGGLYFKRRSNKVTIIPLRNVLLRAYDPNRDDEHWLEAQDCIYGNRASSSFFRFVKKYINLGWEIRYVDSWNDEHHVLGAVHNNVPAFVKDYEDIL